MLADHVEEELMDAGVVAQLRVEGCGQQMVLADEDRIVAAGGEDLDTGSGAGDAGSADKDHLQRSPGEPGFALHDCGVDLAAVGVPLDSDVERAQRLLDGIRHIGCEKDHSGAGPEGRCGVGELLEDIEEAALLEELEHGGGLAAGHDEAVDALEVGGQTDHLWGSAESPDRLRVSVIGSLQGEHPDGQVLVVLGCGVARICHAIPRAFLRKVFQKQHLGPDFTFGRCFRIPGCPDPSSSIENPVGRFGKAKVIAPAGDKRSWSLTGRAGPKSLLICWFLRTEGDKG